MAKSGDVVELEEEEGEEEEVVVVLVVALFSLFSE